MFCPKCGAESESARFCRYCGTDLKIAADALKTGERETNRTQIITRDKTSLAIFSKSSFSNADADPDGRTFVTVFGESHTDLTGAPLPPGETRISINCVFGGAEVFVPDDVAIKVTGTCFFGGIQVGKRSRGGIFSSCKSKTPGYEQAARRLHIEVVSVFGGVTIR